jgi:hypothetical protein
MMNIFKQLLWPVRKLSDEVSEEVAEKAAIGARAALGEAPILDALLKGEEVVLEMKISLRQQTKQ